MVTVVIICIVLGILGFLFWASASIRSGVYLKALCSGCPDRKAVYLTFDDGPHAGSTERVLDVLHARGAHATFFMIGVNAEAHGELVRRIVSEGHDIGIHTYSHASLLPLYSLDRMTKDIMRCKSLLQKLSGREVTLFRPPFGVVNPTVARAVKACGLHTVGWNVRSFDTMHTERDDWRERTLSRIMKRVRPGSVILLHDRLPGAASLLSAILERLDAAGYRYDIPLADEF